MSKHHPTTDRDRPLPDPDRSFDDVLGPTWLTGTETFAGLSASEILVFEFIAAVGPVHSRDVQENVPIAERTARDALRYLRESGLVEARPDPRYPNKDIYTVVESD